VKGVPFGLVEEPIIGKYDKLTLWEQLDGIYSTFTSKFMKVGYNTLPFESS
jgi:hypothetical protein